MRLEHKSDCSSVYRTDTEEEENHKVPKEKTTMGFEEIVYSKT